MSKKLFLSCTLIDTKLNKAQLCSQFPSVGHSYVRYQDQGDFITCGHSIVSHDTHSNHKTLKVHSLQLQKKAISGFLWVFAVRQNVDSFSLFRFAIEVLVECQKSQLANVGK